MVRHDIHLFTLFACLHTLEDVGIDTLHEQVTLVFIPFVGLWGISIWGNDESSLRS